VKRRNNMTLDKLTESIEIFRSAVNKYTIARGKKLPAKPGEAIDVLYLLRTERLNADKAIETLKALEKTLGEHITAQLTAVGLESGRGEEARFTRTWKTVAKLEDERKFINWILMNKHNPFDFIQKRLKMEHITDLWNDKKVVPGVEGIRVEDYSLSRAGAK
jgi:hypothetical protein